MDYQTFNSPQHMAPSFGGPYSTSSAPSHSPQQPQLQLPQDPQARLQHANQPFPYTHFANGQAGAYPASLPGAHTAAASGAVMQPGGLSQSQLHQARAAALQQGHALSPSPYSTAPFAPALASPAHPQFAPNRQTASPAASQHSIASPYATPQQTHSPSVSVPAPYAMNPPLSQPAPAQPVAAQSPARPLPQSPVSPVAAAREKQRLDTLFDINQVLIKQLMELLAQGKGGHIGKEESGGQPQASPEYRECMRRLQANLAFLAATAERHAKPNHNMMPGPAIMAAPSAPDDLVKLYAKLQSLYPGWKGAGAATKASPPGPQRLNSTSSQSSVQNSMQPPNSAGLQNNLQPLHSGAMPPNMQLGSNANAMWAMQNTPQQQQ